MYGSISGNSRRTSSVLFLLVLRKRRLVHEQDGRRFYVARAMRGAISLGDYIIISENSSRRKPVYDLDFG